jgi:hypothetical protein
VGTEPHFFFPLAEVVALCPLRRGKGLRGSLRIPNDVLEGLQKANYHERDLVVRKLAASISVTHMYQNGIKTPVDQGKF